MTHNGVSSPSGKTGELGVNGEIGECKTTPEDVLSLRAPGGLVGGEDDGGSAFRGGNLYDCAQRISSMIQLLSCGLPEALY